MNLCKHQKLAVVLSALEFNGIFSLLYPLLNIFIKDYNFQIKLISLSKPKSDEVVKLFRESGIEVVYSDATSSYNLKNLLFLHKALKGYSFIHVHQFPDLYFVPIATIFKKTTLFATEHIAINKRRNKKLFKLFDYIFYSFYNQIICVSKETKERLDYWVNVSDKSIIIQNGVDLSKFTKKIIDKVSFWQGFLQENDVLLIMVARLNKQKDHETLLKAMTLLPNNYKLALVGDGEKKAIIEGFVETYDLQKRVLITGFRSDMPDCLNASDLAILSTNFEGHPIAFIESIATGLPCLVSDVPGVPDIKLNSFDVKFTHKDYKELAEKIVKLTSDKELYKNTQQELLKLAKTFDIKQTAKEYCKIYNNFIQN